MSALADSSQISLHITLSVQSENLRPVPFRIRRLMPLGKLREVYCSQMGLDKDLTYLTFDGYKINDTDTATSLELEENDMLDVVEVHKSNAGDARTVTYHC